MGEYRMKRSELKEIIKEVLNEKKGIFDDELKDQLNLINDIDNLKDYITDNLKIAKKEHLKGLKIGVGTKRQFYLLAKDLKELADKL